MAGTDRENIDEQVCRRVREIWEGKTGEWLSKKWDSAIAKWITEYEFSLVVDAITAVVGYAHRFDATLPPSKRPIPNILEVPKFAFVLRADEKEPGMLECYRLRGRIMTKFSYVDPHEMITVLAAALRDGMSIGAMKRAFDDNETLEGLCAALGVESYEYQEMFGGRETVEQEKFFIRDDQPEWRAWQTYLLNTKGAGSPINKQFGWHFPTQWPPAVATSHPK
jgi:hypothetical protein